MLAHTFRRSTWKSALGMESSYEVFERYRAIRKSERNYLELTDPSDPTVGILRESSSQSA